MAILVGQLIEILKQFDPDREVVIHTLKGENVDVNGYFVQKDINDTNFYLTDLDVIHVTDLDKRFLTNTDETGRFIVKSLVTGKKYYVEPIGNGHPADWGDINPATKKVEGDYGQKYTGCVSEKESLITPENGFKLIETLGAGMSPLSVVYQRDLEYEKLMNKSNEIQG